MAILTLPAANAVAALFPGDPGTRRRNRRALVALTAGQIYYIDPTTGSAGLTSTNTSGEHNFRGMCMRSCAAGDVFVGQESGEVGGWNLTSSNFDDLIYAQDTAGAIGTTAGSTTVVVGRVVPLTDGLGYSATPTKVLRLISSELTTY